MGLGPPGGPQHIMRCHDCVHLTSVMTDGNGSLPCMAGGPSNVSRMCPATDREKVVMGDYR
jgi:hypothetical protein